MAKPCVGLKVAVTLAILSLLFLTGCASSETWGWYVIDPRTPSGWVNVKFLVSGMGATILISLIAAAISILLGLVVALPKEVNNMLG